MKFLKKVMNVLNLKNSLSALGVETCTSEQMSAALAEWERLYKSRDGMALASAISSETARLATIEMKSEISGSNRADFLQKQYAKFLNGIRNVTEMACAKGGVVLKPYFSGDGIEVDCIQAEDFIPIEFSRDGEILGAAFLDRYISGDKVYTRVEQHSFEDDTYVIRNFAFVGDSVSGMGEEIALEKIPKWRGIEPYTEISGINKPLFVYYKMPMANCIDTSSPLGISVFSRAASLIEDAEKQYKRLLWEYESGERALYVDEAAMLRRENGEYIVPDRRLYRLLNTGDDTMFKDWTPTFRDESVINGLNEILRRIEFNSGLAYGTLSDVLNVDRTAEEIRVSKQRSYAHICDIQNSMKTALSALIEAMNTIVDLYCLAPDGEYGVSFEFDDSIVADRRTEFEEKMKLLEGGVIQPWEMRAWYFGEDSETAKRRACESARGISDNFAE